MKPLDRAFVRTARQRPWQFFMADGKTPKVSFGSALVKTVYIARRLRRQIGEQPHGWLAASAFGGRSADELRIDADGPRAGQPELHIVERGTRELRAAVRSSTSSSRRRPSWNASPTW